MFKIADNVVISRQGLKTTGMLGVITYADPNGDYARVRLTDGRTQCFISSSLSLTDKEVAERPTFGFYVFNETCRNSPKKTHETREEAETEAKRLAGNQPAHTFSVLEIISEFKAEVTVKQTK